MWFEDIIVVILAKQGCKMNQSWIIHFIFIPDSLVICACWSCSVPLMRALNSVIAVMLADKQSISSSIFLKSFFIFLIVSVERQRVMRVMNDAVLGLMSKQNHQRN